MASVAGVLVLNGTGTVTMLWWLYQASSMDRMSTLVHKSGAYSDIEIEDRGELVLPQGRMGEIAAYGRPVGTPERIAAYLLTDYLERLGVEVVFGLCGHAVVGLLDALGKS